MERDFQDGATEINKIAFCNFCDEKEDRKKDGIKGVYTFPSSSPPTPFYLLLLESIRESYYDRDSKDLRGGICTNPQKGAQCMNRMIDLSD